ncbi:uncharacterized protein LOC134272635 [Saccostrea cucullata]|uniref:uncharacterized protein LOC134272635 n=1 Tax=Saccostrea cuccullata TaxID=36930 RepID=UPI002ED2641D
MDTFYKYQGVEMRVMKRNACSENGSVILEICPDKPNIKLCVKKVDNDIASAMYWLVSAELDKKNQIEMFHSETPSVKKKYIIEELAKSESELRVIIATSALGMGIDISSCHSVILYGPPTSIVDFVQELEETELVNCIKTTTHLCCDMCEEKCDCGGCEKGELETLLEVNECANCDDAVEDSDTDTDLYYNEDEFSDDGFNASIDYVNI